MSGQILGWILFTLGLALLVKAIAKSYRGIEVHSREELIEDGHEEPTKPYPTCFDDGGWGIKAPGEGEERVSKR